MRLKLTAWILLMGAAVMGAQPVVATQQAAAGLSYPASYRSLALPEIDGGTVVSTGRQTESLRDGLAITVTAPQTVDQAREFYTKALTSGGWTMAPQGRGASVPNLPVTMLSFTKAKLTYSLTITAIPAGGTRIEIRVLEGA